MAQGADDAGGDNGETVDLGPLPGLLGYQVRQAQSAVFRDFGRITAKTGITPGEFSFLTILAHNPGINQIRLARLYRLDKSTLSYATNRLVKRGLVRRIRRAEDKRHYGLWLSEEGRAALDAVSAEVDAQERVMDSALRPGERAKLIDMLARISAALDQQGAD